MSNVDRSRFEHPAYARYCVLCGSDDDVVHVPGRSANLCAACRLTIVAVPTVEAEDS